MAHAAHDGHAAYDAHAVYDAHDAYDAYDAYDAHDAHEIAIWAANRDLVDGARPRRPRDRDPGRQS